MLDDVDPNLIAVSGPAAARVVPLLMEWFHPASVVDLGCDVGWWLRAFIELGVDDVLGYEQSTVAAADLRIPADRFVPFDLGTPLDLDRTFDLALCLEVAEHLPPQASERLIDELVTLAPAVVFSAGVPGQGGDGHINERWGSWWETQFASRGFTRFDVIRHQVWDDPDVQWWYAQNMVVYTTHDHPANDTLRAAEGRIPMDVVHPRLFQEALSRELTTRQIVAALPSALRATARRIAGR